MALGSPLPSGHFSFLYCRMLFEPNDTSSKILKCWCPRFARLQFQTRPRFGSHPNWFTGVLSKNILLNVWIGTGILFRACKSALIVPWVGHANFHLCLGHCSSLSPSICFPSLIILLFGFLHKTTNDLGHAPKSSPADVQSLMGSFKDSRLLHIYSEEERETSEVNPWDK